MRDGRKTKRQLLDELKKSVERNRELEILLEECRLTLEQRVRTEVAKKREIDHLMVEEGRYAAMGDLLGYFAHQWRQPLTVISLLSQDISECYTYGNFTKEYLDITIGKMLQIVQHMSQTIDSFRNFFKTNGTATQFFVDEIVGKTVSFLEASLKYHNIAIEVDMAADLAVKGQPNEYSQVLLHIINNAKDCFIENKTASPKISIKGCREENRTVVTIADNAGGIPEAVIERVFSGEFAVAPAMDGKEIGLYTSRIIVKNNFMGNLNIKNTGQGTEFRIEI